MNLRLSGLKRSSEDRAMQNVSPSQSQGTQAHLESRGGGHLGSAGAEGGIPHERVRKRERSCMWRQCEQCPSTQFGCLWEATKKPQH